MAKTHTKWVQGLAALFVIPVLSTCAGSSGMTAIATPPPEAGVTVAVETITAEDMAREIGVLAHDSLAGRDTPSPGLEAAATYIADRFRSMGLEPAGEGKMWLWDIVGLARKAA